MTLRLLLISTVILAACSSKAPAGGAGPTTPSTTPAGPAMTLTKLENGDRACYVQVTVGAEEKSMEGDFELCPGGTADASALIGKAIAVTTKKQNVLAASCQGDVDCGKSDEVDLVVTITAAP